MPGTPELYVAVDVEADGPIPGPYSMLALGMAVVGRDDKRFYRELQPISDQFDPEAMAVNNLDRDRLAREGASPAEAMTAAAAWVDELRPLGKPVFLAAPAVWDGMFVHWYFMRFAGRNPFGVTGSGIDLRSFWMGRTGLAWSECRNDDIKHATGLGAIPHTHHAADDAAELAGIFAAALRAPARTRVAGMSGTDAVDGGDQSG